MDVTFGVWVATIGALVLVLAVDLFIMSRRPHAMSVREATRWVVFYVTLAVLFGLGIWATAGGRYAGEFFAGYLTEYSLSVDNLFVFVIILTTFAVPAIHQARVLLVGIVLALILRGILIAAGAALVSRFIWVFYIFGAFLIYTGVQLARNRDEEPELDQNPVLKFVERVFPTTKEYDGAKLVTRIDGKRVVTPLAIVMVAIGTTDILFALDSIPAIFGLTQEPYLVFTANMFALMGLRQLYFLLHGLLDKLVYLSIGLAVILAGIGIKLIVEALHEQVGDPWPEIPIWVSLGFIVITLAVTTLASLAKVRRDPDAAKSHGVSPEPGSELEDIPGDVQPEPADVRRRDG